MRDATPVTIYSEIYRFPMRLRRRVRRFIICVFTSCTLRYGWQGEGRCGNL